MKSIDKSFFTNDGKDLKEKEMKGAKPKTNGAGRKGPEVKKKMNAIMGKPAPKTKPKSGGKKGC